MAFLDAEVFLLLDQRLQDLKISRFEPNSLSMSVLRMSTRCWMTGIVVSSLWIVAAIVPCWLPSRLLAGKRRDLGVVLGDLIEQ